MGLFDDIKARFVGEPDAYNNYEQWDEDQLYDEGGYDFAEPAQGHYSTQSRHGYASDRYDSYGAGAQAQHAAPRSAESVTVLPRSQRTQHAASSAPYSSSDTGMYHSAARDSVLEAEESFAQLPRGPVPAARRSGAEMHAAGAQPLYDSSYIHAYEPRVPSTSEPVSRKTAPFSSALDAHKDIYLLQADNYNQAELIVKRMRGGQAVALSLTKVRVDVAKRILDFCFGASCALSFKVEKLGEKVFLFAPPGHELSVADKDKLERAHFISDSSRFMS